MQTFLFRKHNSPSIQELLTIVPINRQYRLQFCKFLAISTRVRKTTCLVENDS